MNYKIKSFLVLFCWLSLIFPLNLSLTDYHNPQANHILDAEVVGDVLIISAMVQGVEFYDISNPGQLNHLTNFNLGGGGWGGGIKANCVKALGSFAYFTTYNGDGLYVVNISNPSNPQNLGTITGSSGMNLENLDVKDNLLAVAAHEDGVLLYNVSNPQNSTYFYTINCSNAWGVRIHNNYVYIADEQTIKIYDVSSELTPIFKNEIEIANAVKDIAIDETLMYVAIGSNGVDVYDISNMEDPQLLDNFNTNTMANRIAVFDGGLAIADWDDVDIINWNGSTLEHVGYKNTGNRTMGIAAKDNFIYSAEWASVQAFEYGEIMGPDLDLNTWELNYPYVEPGFSTILSLDITNNGNSALTISDNYTTHSDFEILNSLSILDPGESQLVEIVYNATTANASGAYRIYSNDPDEPEIICETNGNIDGANVGEAAPDFNLQYVANGNGNFQLSDHLGEVVVIAFFSPM